MSTPVADAVAAVESRGQDKYRQEWEKCMEAGEHDLVDLGWSFFACRRCLTIFRKKDAWFPPGSWSGLNAP